MPSRHFVLFAFSSLNQGCAEELKTSWRTDLSRSDARVSAAGIGDKHHEAAARWLQTLVRRPYTRSSITSWKRLFPTTRSLATATGSAKRRGPALPGFRKRTPSRTSAIG